MTKQFGLITFVLNLCKPEFSSGVFRVCCVLWITQRPVLSSCIALPPSADQINFYRMTLINFVDILMNL